MSAGWVDISSSVASAVAMAAATFTLVSLKDVRDGKFFNEMRSFYVGVFESLLATVKDVLAFRRGGAQGLLVKPPGYWLTQLLGRWLSKSLFAKTFGQTIADARAEYNEALAAGDHEEARRIKRELNFALIRTIIELIAGLPADILVSAVKKVFKKEE